MRHSSACLPSGRRAIGVRDRKKSIKPSQDMQEVVIESKASAQMPEKEPGEPMPRRRRGTTTLRVADDSIMRLERSTGDGVHAYRVRELRDLGDLGDLGHAGTLPVGCLI